MPDSKGNNHAVILSGGGAYGAYEVGVLKAMLSGQTPSAGFAEFDPDVYTGASVGAINAALLVSQSGTGVPSVEAAAFLENAWLNILAGSSQRCGNGAYRIRADLFKYLQPQCLTTPAQSLKELSEDGAFLAESFLARTVNFFNSTGSIPTRALEFIDLSAFVSPEPVNRFVREVISLESIRRSQKALRVVAANWATGELKTFENKDMTEEHGYQALLASAAVPGFFPPQYIDGEPYVDGGVVMNTPLRCAIQAGADFLHVIYLDPDINELPLKVLQNTYNTLDRTILINNATVIEEDIATASWINDGLVAIERVQKAEVLSDTNIRDFIRVAAQIEKRHKQKPYKKLTIHRYHPKYDPGGGGLGILNFDQERLARLIQLGFDDTIHHDCAASHCVVPDVPAGRL
jgi:predicted acylesterase/phospholipase RssA